MTLNSDPFDCAAVVLDLPDLVDVGLQKFRSPPVKMPYSLMN